MGGRWRSPGSSPPGCALLKPLTGPVLGGPWRRHHQPQCSYLGKLSPCCWIRSEGPQPGAGGAKRFSEPQRGAAHSGPSWKTARTMVFPTPSEPVGNSRSDRRRLQCTGRPSLVPLGPERHLAGLGWATASLSRARVSTSERWNERSAEGSTHTSCFSPARATGPGPFLEAGHAGSLQQGAPPTPRRMGVDESECVCVCV